MNEDIHQLLEDWPHESGKVQVRKIPGADGREKLQLRLDLGIIQMELEGRPDGRRPHDFPSLLDWHAHRASEAENASEDFTLTPEECGELQQEGIQFYHRYISLLQIEDYPGVVRDTRRNLDLFDFVAEHAPNEETRNAFEQFRAYVIMVHTKARASMALAAEDHGTAERIVRDSIAHLRALDEERGQVPQGESGPEVQFLEQWLAEMRSDRPVSEIEKIERRMQEAIRLEAYEEAAKLRDALRLLRQEAAVGSGGQD